MRQRMMESDRRNPEKIFKNQEIKYCYSCKRSQDIVNNRCRDCRQREGSQTIKKILVDSIAAQIKVPVVVAPVIQIKPQVRLPQPELEIKKDNILEKKEHHSEEEGSGKDLRKLDMDSYIVQQKITRKELYVKDGINIGAVCMNKHCEAFKQLVYFGLVLGSEDGGMG